jgi:hypothetical protein
VRTFGVGHIIGGALGGAAFGIVLAGSTYLINDLLPRPVVVGTAAAALALLTIRAVGFRLPYIDKYVTPRRQVPQFWAAVYTPRVTGVLYGICLGFGLVTTADIAMPQALIALSLTQNRPVVALASGFVYGLVRATTPVVIAMLGGSTNRVSSIVERSYLGLRIGSALLAVACIALIVAV